MTDTKFKFATLKEIKDAIATEKNGRNDYSTRSKNNLIPNTDTPFGVPLSEIFNKEAGISDGYEIRGMHISHLGRDSYYKFDYKKTFESLDKLAKHATLATDCPYFLTLPRNQARHGFKVSKPKFNEELQKVFASAENLQFFDGTYGNASAYATYYWYYNEGFGNTSVMAQVTVRGQKVWMLMTFEFAESALGLTITEDMNATLNNGQVAPFDNYEHILLNCHAYRAGNWRSKIDKFDFTFDTLRVVNDHIGMNRKNMNTFLKALDKVGYNAPELPIVGIAKTYKKVEALIPELKEQNPLAYCAFLSLITNCHRSVEGVKISVIFNHAFETVIDVKGMLTALKSFYDYSDEDLLYSNSYDFDKAIQSYPIYKEKRKAVLKSQANRAITKIMEDAESLTIDKKKHKLTWAQIESGELPIGTFFRKSEQYFILNDNWDLWEEMFKRGYGDQAIELAKEVKGRTTYEKDLMSYFYFVLYGLPKYLKRHTGHKWTCIPKLVSSSEELEPPKEEGGVSRSRSALTPVADNDTHTVVVPYASLAISGGFGTTYCYSHDYHVLSEGFSMNGYAVSKDIEEKLNGRDDYGLMFYTLTGSIQGQGYPTFLIIFERRASKGDTRVHFHRTHPSRSKGGDYNPIHNWTRVCYNWMAGNIKSDRIKAQQGDLTFVQVKTDGSGEDLDGASVKNLAFDHKVEKYDNHCFAEPVDFAEYTKAAKSNILGYVRLEKDTWLNHNEHDNVLIPQGTYAIHQCRSWEANPKGVWSLRID